MLDLGLTKSQAKAYLCLVQFGPSYPPGLAKKISESRTNTYKVLDKLVELGLARKKESLKKMLYTAGHPSALETLAKKHREEVLSQEHKINTSMPTLLNFFYTYSEQPGVRFFQGKDGIKNIFDDMLRTRQNIYLVRSPADIEFYDEKFFSEFKAKRAKLGIKTYALTPDISSANHDEQIDKTNLFFRSWIGKDDYTGSVEWNMYGNKLAIISYGEEAIGMIIESPLIAESFRQLFELLSSRQSQTA